MSNAHGLLFHGVGKTIYAREITEHIDGVRFSIDEWISTLFWMDTSNPLEAAWSVQRVERRFNQT